MRFIVSIYCSLCCMLSLHSQHKDDKQKTTNFPELKKIQNEKIPGTDELTQPKFITGTKERKREGKEGGNGRGK